MNRNYLNESLTRLALQTVLLVVLFLILIAPIKDQTYPGEFVEVPIALCVVCLAAITLFWPRHS